MCRPINITSTLNCRAAPNLDNTALDFIQVDDLAGPLNTAGHGNGNCTFKEESVLGGHADLVSPGYEQNAPTHHAMLRLQTAPFALESRILDVLMTHLNLSSDNVVDFLEMVPLLFQIIFPLSK